MEKTPATDVELVRRLLRKIGVETDSGVILERAKGRLTEGEIKEALRTLKWRGELVAGERIPYFTSGSDRVACITLNTYA